MPRSRAESLALGASLIALRARGCLISILEYSLQHELYLYGKCLQTHLCTILNDSDYEVLKQKNITFLYMVTLYLYTTISIKYGLFKNTCSHSLFLLLTHLLYVYGSCK